LYDARSRGHCWGLYTIGIFGEKTEGRDEWLVTSG